MRTAFSQSTILLGHGRVPCDQRRLHIARHQREVGFNEVTRIAGTNQFVEQRTLVIVQVWRRFKPGWLAVNPGKVASSPPPIFVHAVSCRLHLRKYGRLAKEN